MNIHSPIMLFATVCAITALSACGTPRHTAEAHNTTEPTRVQPEVRDTSAQPPPWRWFVGRDQIPAVYLSEWAKAKNRAHCALLVVPEHGQAVRPEAKARRAEFAGGWAVAYDLPNRRGAYGVAGTGVSLSKGGDEYQWPKQQRWSDGSRMSYGLEGGTGPTYLAYLHVAGQNCLYNVWSTLGETHLLQLVDDLRRVR